MHGELQLLACNYEKTALSLTVAQTSVQAAEDRKAEVVKLFTEHELGWGKHRAELEQTITEVVSRCKIAEDNAAWCSMQLRSSQESIQALAQGDNGQEGLQLLCENLCAAVDDAHILESEVVEELTSAAALLETAHVSYLNVKTRNESLDSEVAAKEREIVALKERLSNLECQCRDEQQNKELAQAALEVEQAARGEAEARAETASAKACTSESIQKEQEGRARQELEQVRSEYDNQIAHLQEDLSRMKEQSEELRCSRDSLRTETDAMRREHEEVMQQKRWQEHEEHNALV